eukprot:TRINITY_DN2406_c0_g1_i3.p1 TRINITY_DN2406_c0_g1~~TRINITY_DN2406_c0_g1_i3.p1  ORF type:complete len:178 (+),score=11.15 TRINITY_DN2406_c0_g1_i3:64-597(+)
MCIRDRYQRRVHGDRNKFIALQGYKVAILFADGSSSSYMLLLKQSKLSKLISGAKNLYLCCCFFTSPGSIHCLVYQKANSAVQNPIKSYTNLPNSKDCRTSGQKQILESFHKFKMSRRLRQRKQPNIGRSSHYSLEVILCSTITRFVKRLDDGVKFIISSCNHLFLIFGEFFECLRR